jgi:hypothetical protein
VMTDRMAEGELMLELVPLTPDEITTTIARLWSVLT